MSTTGVLSRELMEINNSLNKKFFYCVGGMGHAISIANGIAIKKKKEFSVLMVMVLLFTI